MEEVKRFLLAKDHPTSGSISAPSSGPHRKFRSRRVLEETVVFFILIISAPNWKVILTVEILFEHSRSTRNFEKK